MNIPHLTDEQIRSTVFEITDAGLASAYSPEIASQMLALRRLVEAHGHELHFYGWPDGTTVSCELTEPHLAFDIDYLVSLYRSFQVHVRPQMEAQSGSE